MQQPSTPLNLRLSILDKFHQHRQGCCRSLKQALTWTKFKMVDVVRVCDMDQQQTASAEDVIKSFSLQWLPNKPKPQYVIPRRSVQ